MIIELLGPGGVGKTTVEPLLADRLGIAYYPGKKRHDLIGRPQSSVEVWATRFWSVFSNPSLAFAALKVFKGSPTDRWRFAFDMCRRERAAARARRLGSGVLASGPIHALCMMSGNDEDDVSSIVPHLTRADVYVRLRAEPAEVTRRLAGRLGQPLTELRMHESWMSKYESAANHIASALERPMLDVRADGSPSDVAEAIAERIGQLQ